ncbi:MAG: hypothetical protein HFJ06_09145 [Lachnospiraceae bacterium]|nr:hypothetical protein [Lachnospiraceae bacterium]
MKKIITILSFAALLLFLAPAACVHASAAQLKTEALVSSTTTQLENGNSIVTEITVSTNDTGISTFATAKTKSGKKTVTYRNSKGNALWSFSISANFSYNGSSATCTSVSTSKTINDTAWKLSNITKSKSSNVAKGSVTAKECLLGIPFNIVTENLQLKCSANGTLS